VLARLWRVGRSKFDPPEADKCLLASGEFDVYFFTPHIKLITGKISFPIKLSIAVVGGWA
jgi:hypothetical protein